MAETVSGLPGTLSDLMCLTVAVADRWVRLDADTVTVAEAGALLEGLDRQMNRLEGAVEAGGLVLPPERHRATGHKNLGHWMQGPAATNCPNCSTAPACPG